MNLKKLSGVLGLSQTTVSRALNGYPEVSESTRERVLKAAKQHHYRPNTKAMSLATGKAMAIGHVIPVYSNNEVVNPVFGEFIAGASQTYSNRGYELLLIIADDKDENTTYRNIADKGAVDGVIVHSPLRNDTRIKLLQDIGLPFVIHGRGAEDDVAYSWVDVNNHEAFFQATQHLLDLGHRRIALVNGPETLSFAWRRSQGYLQALHNTRITTDRSIMSDAEMTEANGYASSKTMLEQPNPPTAFLVSSYVMALGVRQAISEQGLRLGKDVSVIIHDDELSYFNNSGDPPQFTATRSSVRQAGATAAQLLLDIIDDPSNAPLTHLLEAHLSIGASTGPVRGISPPT